MSANVAPEEVAKFEALAARWWDPQGEFRTLHDINPLRLALLERDLDLSGLRVLDVGCGGGLMTEAMARAGARVTGIDMSGPVLAVARLHAQDNGLEIDYRQSTAEALCETAAGEFELVTCLELLEHVPDPARLVGACAALAASGGWLYFSTINRTPKAYLQAVLSAEYLLHLLPRGTHDYARFIRPSELARWARAAGLRPSDTCGLTYNPLTRRYRLRPEVDVNYFLQCRKQPGEG